MVSNEEYRDMTPLEEREENDSEFLFICRNPKRLILPIGVSGNHKICKQNQFMNLLLTYEREFGPFNIKSSRNSN